MGSPWEISLAVVASIIGIICLAAAVIGYFLRVTNIFERLLLFAAAFLLIKPGLVTDIIGLICIGIVVIFQMRKPYFRQFQNRQG